MSQWMRATFLGTCSGGGPTETRNCSSLVLDIIGDGSLWLIDCAEGTLRQFVLQPSPRRNDDYRKMKASKISNIFITHMHADHIMGLVTMLRNLLGYPSEVIPTPGISRPRINIYGPAGLRLFIRTNLTLTRTRTAESYAVHELLAATDEVTPCEPDSVRHSSEGRGRDILCDDSGFWNKIAFGRSGRGEVHCYAGPIIHRDPCIGYIFCEPDPHPQDSCARRPRKIVILGDTSDTSAFTSLIASTPGTVSLLVHEATDVHIPSHIDRGLAVKRPPNVVQRACADRGHSTPADAGRTAGLWGAEQLVLNHIGARFSAPTGSNSPYQRQVRAIIQEMEHQASEEWKKTSAVVSVGSWSEPTWRAIAAYDYLTVDVQPSSYVTPLPAGPSRPPSSAFLPRKGK
ncbi:beta-lactamase-like protein [Vararia minispora EC-137]|uniref:Beta-lactamase-like protein n=1 Tax=Vararia minispora EC-137 TaxID=1314806 RepID=A0ACB8QYL3_9AGAM|nr:beta-lactamase-like protein [Vararia minispora EC-137]